MADAAALLGTWKMVSWTREVVATGDISDAMGPEPIGYLAYHADGRMFAFVLELRRPAFTGKPPTDEEKIRLFDSMLAYTATYSVEDKRVVHHVDAAWTPGWVGDLIRPFSLDQDSLTISGAPSRDPRTGEDVLYRLVFRRLG